MIGGTIVMPGIMVVGVVVVCQWKQRRAGHFADWPQQRAVEPRKGAAASRLPESLERRQKLDHAKASVARIDGERSRLTEAWEHYFARVGHHASEARGSPPR
jgi:hypothetical protein